MKNRTKLLSVIALLSLFGCQQQSGPYYRVELIYINGEKDTLVLENSMRNRDPFVDDGGCVYNFEYRTHICGVRKINIISKSDKKPK